MERLVIVRYQPKEGKRPALIALLRSHVPRLRAVGLATAREPILMQAGDGSFLEAFGWVSREAIDQAHTNPAVQQMWQEFAEVCDYQPAASLEEFQRYFAAFDPVEGSGEPVGA